MVYMAVGWLVWVTLLVGDVCFWSWFMVVAVGWKLWVVLVMGMLRCRMSRLEAVDWPLWVAGWHVAVG